MTNLVKSSLFSSLHVYPGVWSASGRLHTSASSYGKTKHRLRELRSLSSCDRALEHFDDFYGTFFGKKKWPLLRLGLLSAPKYAAIPNPYTGNLERITKKLEQLGAYNLQTLWREGKAQLENQANVDVKKDLGSIHALERTLESIALTKKAEEMETLYKVDDALKKGLPNEIIFGVSSPSSSDFSNNARTISHPSQVAFVPPTRLKGVDDFTFDSEYYAGYLPQNLRPMLDPDDDHPFEFSTKEKINSIVWPSLLNPFVFEPGSGSEFPGSARDPSSSFREYICVNGASIWPILALDLRPNCEMLDLCAGPGTKSLMALMTMSLGGLTANDLDSNRLGRVKKIFGEFTGTEFPELVTYSKQNGKAWPYRERKFDRILADVPCLNDRISCIEPENNIFKTTRTKERLNLVHTQKDLLASALKALKKEDGSVCVYSTCTLSPVENDGVVMHALKETEVGNLAVDIYGLISLLQPLEVRGLLRFSRTRFGALIEPHIGLNFGPMYISRIIVQSKVQAQEQAVKENQPETE